MNKKKIIIIVILIVLILFGIYMLYNTFAINFYTSSNNDIYNITLTEDNNTVTVPSNSNKTVYYHVKNTNKAAVKYAVGYTSSNVEVLVYEDTNDKVEDVIDYGESKFIKLYLKNTSDTNGTVTLKTILGYENGGDLVVPTDSTLVTKKYKKPVSLAKYITNLYTNASKTKAQNNGIEYNYASSESLMNDRLGGTTTDLDGGNIRYYGASPNNYIYFNCEEYPDTNCEKWRIIGVFNNQVKIMRNEIISGYSWDTSESTVNSGYGVNEWSQADLMKLLNPGYESESVGGSLYYNKGSGTCYNGSSNATTSCDFTSTGIKNSDTKNKIAEVTWNLGGWNSASVFPNQIYGYERGTKVVSNPSDGITRTTVWPGKVALPYPSDYGYATDFNKCSQNLYNYGSSTDSYACRKNDWMYPIITNGGATSGWLLTPYSGIAYHAFIVHSSGCVRTSLNFGASGGVYDANGAAPVLYLSSEQVIESGGDGSQNSPYKLG